jgi:hypothetical protein
MEMQRKHRHEGKQAQSQSQAQAQARPVSRDKKSQSLMRPVQQPMQCGSTTTWWDFRFSRRRVWRCLCSGLRRGARWMWTDVSDVLTASTIRTIVLIMKAVTTSETSAIFYRLHAATPRKSAILLVLFVKDYETGNIYREPWIVVFCTQFPS